MACSAGEAGESGESRGVMAVVIARGHSVLGTEQRLHGSRRRRRRTAENRRVPADESRSGNTLHVLSDSVSLDWNV